uniref:SWIM-type domain-containing protein n=1 Tax=Rhizophagus irregularis (strain DAOM 181602 / DAOM 197198 / MUCL 43194) TaxID=747089 RepID=U9SVZ4_RHIID
MEPSFESFNTTTSETHLFNNISNYLSITMSLLLDNTQPPSNQVSSLPLLDIEDTNLIQYGETIPHLQSCPTLAKGMNFPNFEIAIHYCIEFGRFNGFSVKKKRVEKNNDASIKSRCIDCEYSGRIRDNNKIMIRNKGSKKTKCSWHINLSQPLNVNYVKITKFVNTHNHELLPDNTLFAPQFRGLSEDIKSDIEHYVKCGREFSNSGSDGATLLNELFIMQKDDPSFIVIPQVDPFTSRLNGIFWMTSDQQMLYSRYNDVILHDNTALTNHYKWPLSLFVIVDSGMQSTQHIEGLNGILHREIEASMSLTNTFHKIIERLETENMNKRFLTFKHSKTHYFQPLMVTTSTYHAKLIGDNDIFELLHYQDELDLENQINSELINNGDESTIAIFIEDKYKDKKIFLKNLLQEFNIDDIREIWKVESLLACSPTSCQYVVILKNGWHACTCLLLANSGVICHHYFKVMMESNFAKFHINMIPKRWYKEHLQSDLMKINNSPVVTLGNERLSRKASQLAIEDRNDELKDFLNKFIEKRKKNHEMQESNRRLRTIDNVVNKNVRSAEINGKIVFEANGRVYATDEINELLEHIAKGRPANKRLKSSIEISGKSSGNILGKENANKKEYICSKCKEIGHNVRTCKK